MVAKQAHFSPKRVAESLAVSESSVKRWCDRGLIPTIRTLGGHRRISIEGLSHFLAETDQVIPNPEVLGLPKLPRRRQKRIPGSDCAERKKFRSALAAGDEEACRNVLRDQLALGNGNSVASVVNDFVTDAMTGMGKAWECESIDVYQERIACGICVRLINECRMELKKRASLPLVALGGSPAGDHYELPTALIELALLEEGWQAQNLGTNIPLESFLQAAHDHQANLVWISVSSIQDREKFVKQHNQLAESLNDHVVLIVGGRALCDELRPQIAHTAHCDSIPQMVDLVSMLQFSVGR